jgi:ribonuclease BN (tRNA processing enzyme)
MPKQSVSLWPLGSGGWIPANGFETLCFSFFSGNDLFIIDAGTGISRLVELRDTLFKHEWPDIARVHVFLTHYHFDHVTGLYWLRPILGGIPVTVYAPGVAVYGRPAAEILQNLYRRPYSPRAFLDLIPNVNVAELAPPGLTVDTEPEPVHVAVKLNARHSDPSVSLRFADWFAIATDTPCEDETVDFARGAKVLLHESWFDSSDRFTGEDDDLEKHTEGPHAGTFGAGLVAKRAGAQRLYLIHHNPESSMRELEAGAKRVAETLRIDCRIARDLEEIVIER